MSSFTTKADAQNFLDRISEYRNRGKKLDKETLDMELSAFLFVRSSSSSENFYKTRAWRSLRYRVLKLRGRRCECCGSTPSDGKSVHVDHIKPRSKNPELELTESNLQVLCADCNLGKGNSDSIAWGGHA